MLNVNRAYPMLNGVGGNPSPFFTQPQLEEWATRRLADVGQWWFHATTTAKDDRTATTLAVLWNGTHLTSSTRAEIDAFGDALATGTPERVVIDPSGYTVWPSSAGTLRAYERRAPVPSDNVPELINVMARWGAVATARRAESEQQLLDVANVIDQLIEWVKQGMRKP